MNSFYNKKLLVITLTAAFVIVGLYLTYFLVFQDRRQNSLPAGEEAAKPAEPHFYPLSKDRFSQANEVGAIIKSDRDDQLDSNGDGITDKQAASLRLNPYLIDTDGDGIFDVDEINITKTDPLKKDTDGDSYGDLEELRNGYNPKGAGKLESKK